MYTRRTHLLRFALWWVRDRMYRLFTCHQLSFHLVAPSPPPAACLLNAPPSSAPTVTSGWVLVDDYARYRPETCGFARSSCVFCSTRWQACLGRWSKAERRTSRCVHGRGGLCVFKKWSCAVFCTAGRCFFVALAARRHCLCVLCIIQYVYTV